jgi:type IV pilus assembly protein PilB
MTDTPEPPSLRIYQPEPVGEAEPGPGPGPGPGPEPPAPAPPAPPLQSFGVNSSAELVADLVAATGLLGPDRLAQVRGRASSTRSSFVQALIDEGLASDNGIGRLHATRHQLPFIELSFTGVDQMAAKLLPLHVLERGAALPYALRDEVLSVAIADPTNVHAIDELRLATRYPVEFSVAAREEISDHLKRLARESAAFGLRASDDVPELIVEGEEDEDESDADLDVDDGISEAPLVRLVNSIIFQAAEDGASDIHFEPQEDALLVRFRVDGVLQEIQRIPKRLMNGVLTRLKVIAKLDIAERRKPQDGRMTLNAAAAGRRLDVRVATLPTVDGESIVMRLLDKSQRAPTLKELGLSDEMRDEFSRIIARPTGALLVTGPTGSGKSTTLYAALTQINSPEINVITVEDPVEYRLTGINQVQINIRAGLTFATALRSILRSDPDVVMVGEIRDGETAKISIEAALTGHFVLSTLHTNDAPSVLTRLNEMGVEPFLTGAAVSAVLAQRLARKLCSHCCEMYTPSMDDLLKARVSPDLAAASDGVVLYRKRGCPRCSQTGYKGRVGIYQLLTMSEELEHLAAAKASREEIERAAIASGMKTLWDDGMIKVAAGLTSVEELARVCA